MKSTAPNLNLKKGTHPPKHHWCTQKEKQKENFNATLTLLRKENFPDKLCWQLHSILPQHFTHASRWHWKAHLQPSLSIKQVFKLQKRGRMMPCQESFSGTWEMQPQLCAMLPFGPQAYLRAWLCNLSSGGTTEGSTVGTAWEASGSYWHAAHRLPAWALESVYCISCVLLSPNR